MACFEHTCRICRTVFQTNIHNKYTCSPECSKAWSKKADAERANRQHQVKKKRQPKYSIEQVVQYGLENNVSYGNAVHQLEYSGR